MAFELPPYQPPDFNRPPFKLAPPATFRPVRQATVAPNGFHATSIFPEYIQVARGDWRLLRDSRMDCVIVLDGDRGLAVREFRHLRPGDQVACGRSENGEDGIFVHSMAFTPSADPSEAFAFRTRTSRETSFSIDYDELYQLLQYERDRGYILWVAGPAVAFDRDAREAFASVIEKGYVHGLLAGNALAVHDMEAALFQTALGQEIYSKRQMPLGHYNHLDTINRIRSLGSIDAALREGWLKDGIMRALLKRRVPYVLAGSIRDDGPLPEVMADVYAAQDSMRNLARKATTVIAMATQLHTIATGNMIPAYRTMEDDRVRPVYFYSVDMSQFATDKLANRGSLTARFILTNIQDFIVTLNNRLPARTDSLGDCPYKSL